MNPLITRQWHEICALLLKKAGTDHVVFTEQDFKIPSGYISAEVLEDGLHIRMIDPIAAERINLLQNMVPTDPN